MKIETICLVENGNTKVFTISDDIPEGNWKIMKITLDDGSIITW